ncbi:MAG TPA: YicC family protein [Candidatus Galloscillospira stercoripullorum]|nr:YicC family protein [Candidatus Galloscillospira stercoripullorum]
MTGYGRAQRVYGSRTVTIELRSVNNRYLDCTVKMPRAYISAEDALKGRIQALVARGKVDVFVTVVSAGDKSVTVTVNEPLAKAYLEALYQLSQLDERKQLQEDCTITELARFPDVLTAEKGEEDLEELKEQLLAVLEEAVDDFSAMRTREGDKLRDDILSRAGRIEELVAMVEERSPGIVADYRARLSAKMAEVLQNTQIDESRILTEAAIYADKVAVDEETVRLKSHLSQLRQMLSQGGAVGRKLDFLIQEFNREANTIGSKCNDIETTRYVVDIKAEIEKIREQVQNIE